MSELDLMLFVLGCIVLIFLGAMMVIKRMLVPTPYETELRQRSDAAWQIAQEAHDRREQFERECG